MKPFTSLLYILAMAVFLSFQMASADEAPLVTFSIDKTVYGKMSEDQRNKLIQKLQELNTFIEEKVRTKIPDELQLKTQDLKIKISLTDKPGRDGLFVPAASGEHVITIQLVQVYTNGINALVAHEIFHAIHYQVNPDELPWVREGMAQLFEFITTGELNGMNMAAAVMNPNTPLLGNYNIDESNPAQYGHDELYFYYLYSHCGQNKLFWKLTAGTNDSSVKGSYLIDAVLNSMGLEKSECKDFSESAISFEVAKTHNQYQFMSEIEKEKYFVLPSDISPVFYKPLTSKDLKNTIDTMPALSSFRMPAKKYSELAGTCKNCAVYFANRDFPYSILEKTPSDTTSFDIILVKLKNN